MRLYLTLDFYESYLIILSYKNIIFENVYTIIIIEATK